MEVGVGRARKEIHNHDRSQEPRWYDLNQRLCLYDKCIVNNNENKDLFSYQRNVCMCADKDVTRTDRLQDYFRGEGNPNLQVLYDILMTYCMYDFDLGYVQGMSDLLAPILVVMENEVDAFWCLVGLVNKLVGDATACSC